MKVCVTGAAGFIGSHLSETLLRRGDRVVGVDNFNDYYNPAIKRSNAALLASHANFKLVEADIRDRQKMLDLFKDEQFDAVAHLAAMAGVRFAVEHPEVYGEVNVNGTINLLDGARFNNVKNFVFASTSSVYGDTKIIPFIETDPCNNPLQPYAATKKAAEVMGFSYHHLFDLSFTAVRFFTVYGPRGRPDMMAYKVLDNIFTGREVPLYNKGQMYRDWTFVEDTVAGVVAAIDRPLGYEIINLGRGEPILLADFIELLEKLAGRKANLIPAPMMSADVVYTYADITKAKTLLGYKPHVSVEEGVARFWEWYRDSIL
ncbi:MAG: SDR family NAD(P)-dependent oxidoreductase [Anaerolineales bacterium]|nr:SDR family NAD(P)-dependent oxidoreductase [Anaerolineales bacterium]